jgi:hypothetical protein
VLDFRAAARMNQCADIESSCLRRAPLSRKCDDPDFKISEGGG